MPRIPVMERQVGIGAQQTAARIDPSMFATAGTQLGGAADAVVQFVAARDKARNEADLIRAKAAASREMTNLQLEMEQDTDWRTMDQRFTEKARDLHDRVSGNISDPSTKASFSLAFDELTQAKTVAVRRRSWDLESNQSRADLDTVLTENAKSAANATTPVDSARYIKDGLDAIKSMQPAARAAVDSAAMGTSTATLANGKDASLTDRAVSVAKDVGMGLVEAPVQAVGGISDAVHETFTALDHAGWALNDWIKKHTGFDGSLGNHPGDPNLFTTLAGKKGEVPEATTTTGGIIRDVAQFLTGFIPAMRGARVVGAGEKVAAGGKAIGIGEAAASRIGHFAESTAAGAASTFVTQDPYEAGLSNLIQQHPALANPVNDFLAANPGDNEALARFKKSLEGAGFGAVTEVLGIGLSALRNIRRGGGPGAPGAPGAVVPDGAPPAAPAAQALERDLAAMGDPNAPLVSVVRTGKDVAKAEVDRRSPARRRRTAPSIRRCCAWGPTCAARPSGSAWTG
ncbi:MAG: hypothetical protein Q7R40_17080 [Phaeospirillum sp.]|nr:hypothetical protein [Phaeospirillum sp.]